MSSSGQNPTQPTRLPNQMMQHSDPRSLQLSSSNSNSSSPLLQLLQMGSMMGNSMLASSNPSSSRAEGDPAHARGAACIGRQKKEATCRSTRRSTLVEHAAREARFARHLLVEHAGHSSS